MAFSKAEAEALLVACHRRCCICHRWCGSKIELDHMTPSADGGSDDIENAIPVCFDCHAEIHAYDVRHPRGRRFSARELRMHKQQWLEICANRPEILVRGVKVAEAGPIYAIADELEYNLLVARGGDDPDGHGGGFFLDEQFRRAMALGTLSMLDAGLRTVVMTAYAATSKAAGLRMRAALGAGDDYVFHDVVASVEAHNVHGKLEAALELIRRYLAPEL